MRRTYCLGQYALITSRDGKQGGNFHMFEAFFVALSSVWSDSGFSALTGGHVIMIAVGLVLLYMAIGKGFEPLLLSPIAFGCILATIPGSTPSLTSVIKA